MLGIAVGSATGTADALNNVGTMARIVTGSPIDIFRAAGDALSQAEANYNSIKAGLTKIVADAYITNLNGLSIPQDALLVTGTEVNIIAKIWDYLAPIGYAMLLLYFLLTIVQDVQGKVRDLDIKYWTITIMKFVCIDALIYLGPNLVIWGMQAGNGFIQYFYDNPVAGTPNDQSYVNYVNAITEYFANGEGKKFWVSAGLLVYAIILKAANTIPSFMILLHAASRKIEIILRGGLLCIAIPDMVMSGPHSRGISYIKKFFGTCLYGFVMLLVVQIAGALSAANVYSTIMDGAGLKEGFASNMGGLLNCALYNFAAVGMLSASKSIINDFLS